VGDRSATHRAAVEDGYMPEEPHIEEAAQAQVGTPKPAMDRPTGTRQIVRRPAPAHLHDRDFIPLLHQPKGRNTAAETRTDNNKVEVELVVALGHRFLVPRFHSQADSLHIFLFSNRYVDHLSNPPQRFGTGRRIESKHLEVMGHVLPGFEDDIRPLLKGAIREGLNARVENLGAASLYVDRGKSAQVSP